LKTLISLLATTLTLVFANACSGPPPDVCGAIEDRLRAVETEVLPQERSSLAHLFGLALEHPSLLRLPPGLDEPTLDSEVRACVRRLSGRVADQIHQEPTHAGVVGWYSFVPMLIDARADLRDFLRILEPDTGARPVVRDERGDNWIHELGYLIPPVATSRVFLAAKVIIAGGRAGIDALDAALSHPLPGARLLAAQAADSALRDARGDVGAIFEVLRLHEFDPDPQVAAKIERAMSQMLKVKAFECP
jgi:hypothetical protein